MSTVQPAVRQVGEAGGAVRTGEATYRLQLTVDFDFEACPRPCPTCGARDQPSLLVAHHGGPPRIGARLRRDRPDPGLRRARGRGAFRALAQAAHEAGMGLILDVVPNHMAASDENPLLVRSASAPGRSSTSSRAQRVAPAVLHIDDLAGVRVEDPEVFDETHRTLLELVARRLDRRPADRPHRRSRGPRRVSSGCATAASSCVWVEKILERGEQLRDWPVQGTTGYEFANDVTALFIDPRGEQRSRDLYAELTGRARRSRRSRARAKPSRREAAFRRRSRSCARSTTTRIWSARSPRCRSTAPTCSHMRVGRARPTGSPRARFPRSCATC